MCRLPITMQIVILYVIYFDFIAAILFGQCFKYILMGQYQCFSTNITEDGTIHLKCKEKFIRFVIHCSCTQLQLCKRSISQNDIYAQLFLLVFCDIQRIFSPNRAATERESLIRRFQKPTFVQVCRLKTIPRDKGTLYKCKKYI